MIVGLSHVTLGCRGIQEGAKILGECGFLPKFIHPVLANAAGKKRFLVREKAPSHALSFCQSEGALAIELVDYFKPLPMLPSVYQVLFSRPLPHLIPVPEPLKAEAQFFSSVWEAALGQAVEVRFWKPFQTLVGYPSASSESSGVIRALLLEATEFSAAAHFWTEGLGCQLVQEGTVEGKRWIRCRFTSPVGRGPLEVILWEGKSSRRLSYMDDTGFSCLSFLTVGLEQVGQRLAAKGACALGETFSLEVGGRFLKAKVLRGASNELLELIELQLEREPA